MVLRIHEVVLDEGVIVLGLQMIARIAKIRKSYLRSILLEAVLDRLFLPDCGVGPSCKSTFGMVRNIRRVLRIRILFECFRLCISCVGLGTANHNIFFILIPNIIVRIRRHRGCWKGGGVSLLIASILTGGHRRQKCIAVLLRISCVIRITMIQNRERRARQLGGT